MQTQTVSCQLSGAVVDDSMCDPATKPPTEQPCDVGECVWSEGSFGPCSVTCGTGTQTRTVDCTNDNGIVAEANCDAGSKPDTTQSCDAGICPDWVIDDAFGEVSKLAHVEDKCFQINFYMDTNWAYNGPSTFYQFMKQR